MVGAEGGHLKPALGESWKNIPHMRLHLSCDRESNIRSMSILRHPYIVSTVFTHSAHRTGSCLFLLFITILDCIWTKRNRKRTRKPNKKKGYLFASGFLCPLPTSEIKKSPSCIFIILLSPFELPSTLQISFYFGFFFLGCRRSCEFSFITIDLVPVLSWVFR